MVNYLSRIALHELTHALVFTPELISHFPLDATPPHSAEHGLGYNIDTVCTSHTHTLTPTPLSTPSHPHTLIHTLIHTLTPSHPHTLTPSHPHTLTPLHPHTLTPSHPHPYPPSHPHTPTGLLRYGRALPRSGVGRACARGHAARRPRRPAPLWLSVATWSTGTPPPTRTLRPPEPSDHPNPQTTRTLRPFVAGGPLP
jgi:hypothetical protein